MRRAMLLLLSSFSMVLPSFAAEQQSMDPRFLPQPAEEACRSLTLASAGGPALKDSKILLLRWLGFSTYELVYGNQIILLDNYYDRGPRYRDLGFKAADVKRANLILVGHGHSDHMSDTAQTVAQTGAPVITAPVSAEKLLAEGVPADKIMQATGTDGHVYSFNGFTVQPILGRHGEPGLAPGTAAFRKAYADAYPATPEERDAQRAIGAKGTNDPRITAEGMLAFVITFDDGFRVAWRDSGGFMTDYEKAAMAKIGPVDILIGAVAANVVAEANIKVLMPMIETYRPQVYFPAHHEEETGSNLDRATEPLFQAIKDRFPGTLTISKEFREPTCFDTRFNIKSGNAKQPVR
ncbi:MAG TPA: MBL fold metallo-hydrolase [Rhizomicrobium sp.]|nr:MBL fold metallo-hydrolase [Rhizomicrobium sp.]